MLIVSVSTCSTKKDFSSKRPKCQLQFANAQIYTDKHLEGNYRCVKYQFTPAELKGLARKVVKT